MAQWRERSSPTNVARVRFPDSASFMWVEFALSSPCSEDISPVLPVFPSPQKLTFLNSNSTRPGI